MGFQRERRARSKAEVDLIPFNPRLPEKPYHCGEIRRLCDSFSSPQFNSVSSQSQTGSPTSLSLRSLGQPAWRSHQLRSGGDRHRCVKFGERKGGGYGASKGGESCLGLSSPLRVVARPDRTVSQVSGVVSPPVFLVCFKSVPVSSETAISRFLPSCLRVGGGVTGSPCPPPESRERPWDLLLSPQPLLGGRLAVLWLS